MARKHHKPEEIVAKLRQVEVMTGQGKSVLRRAWGPEAGPGASVEIAGAGKRPSAQGARPYIGT